MTHQLNLIEPEHESVEVERADTGYAEKVYSDEWKKKNKQESWLNGGYGLLELLLGHPPTQKEASAAATAIQWLGTNCGMGFLHECERQIDEVRKAKNKFNMTECGDAVPLGENEALVTAIAMELMTWFSKPISQRGKSDLQAAKETVRKILKFARSYSAGSETNGELRQRVRRSLQFG